MQPAKCQSRTPFSFTPYITHEYILIVVHISEGNNTTTLLFPKFGVLFSFNVGCLTKERK